MKRVRSFPSSIRRKPHFLKSSRACSRCLTSGSMLFTPRKKKKHWTRTLEPVQSMTSDLWDIVKPTFEVMLCVDVLYLDGNPGWMSQPLAVYLGKALILEGFCHHPGCFSNKRKIGRSTFDVQGHLGWVSPTSRRTIGKQRIGDPTLLPPGVLGQRGDRSFPRLVWKDENGNQIWGIHLTIFKQSSSFLGLKMTWKVVSILTAV